MRVKVTVAYDGTNYCGWQVQKNGPSIQRLLQGALETVLRHSIFLTGAGRTDAGVHALGQTAHFDTNEEQLKSFPRLLYSVNALLPADIRVLSLERVADNFHARYSAIGKEYHYHLRLEATPNPMLRLYRTPVFGLFDRERVSVAAQMFVGTHDFYAFANKSGKELTDSIRTLKRLDLIEEPGGVRLEFEGSGFLYKMVRNITGTLLEVAARKRSLESIEKLLLGSERSSAGAAVSPQGLFLMAVKYPQANQNGEHLLSGDQKGDESTNRLGEGEPEFAEELLLL